MTPQTRYNDAVIGAGIIGLAHAYHLARRGRRVVVIERDARAASASIRNFGMIWPIGQPLGPLRALANRSAAIWLDLLTSSGLWHRRTGSLHLAYHDDEAQVLREFVQQSLSGGFPVELLDPTRVEALSPSIRRERLRLALWSTEELCVDPREVVAGLPSWLAARHGIDFRFNEPAIDVEPQRVTTSAGRLDVERIWVCSGDEMRVLFPELLRQSGLVRCKLQMMRSQPLGAECQIGPMLAAGLTLRHYASFAGCPTLPAVRERIAREAPWLDRFGIHVLVSQNGHGELTIGDSHEYGELIDPFDRTDVEEWIVGYLLTFLDVPGLRIASRWHGSYAKLPDRPYLVLRPLPGVRLITGVGGAGMTLSFGLAERIVEEELGRG